MTMLDKHHRRCMMLDAFAGEKVNMRTTLSIDDDVLTAAKALAVQQRKSVGEVISALLRQSLSPAATNAQTRNGIPLLPGKQSTPVTPELVNRLRDELP
jgi:Family of unknown function (DUF6364)